MWPWALCPNLNQKIEMPCIRETCGTCGSPNQLEVVCQQKGKPKHALKPPNQQLRGAENTIFNSLCNTGNHAPVRKSTIALDHHLYDHLNNCWTRQASQTQPFITLKVTTCPEDYQTLGLPKPTFTHKSIWASVMADSGCQSCLTRYEIC